MADAGGQPGAGAEWAHYLVWPARSAQKSAVQLFLDWVLEQGQAYRDAEAQQLA